MSATEKHAEVLAALAAKEAVVGNEAMRPHIRNDYRAAISLARLVVETHAPDRDDIGTFCGGCPKPKCFGWPCSEYRAAVAFAGVDPTAPTTQPAVPVVPSDGGGL